MKRRSSSEPSPICVAAVTGTNGKTSVTVFLRQIWQGLGRPAASLGTIGAITPTREVALTQTTPDPIGLHRLLKDLKAEGVEHLAIEASSHGLDQYRLDGVEIAAVGFTNITRDHLDYHPTFEHYLRSKLRLFDEVVRDGGTAVVNADAEHAERFIDAARKRDLRLVTVGEKGADIALDSTVPHGDGPDIVAAPRRPFSCRHAAARGVRSRRRTRWSRRGSPSGWAARRRRCSRCWDISKARRDAWNASRSRGTAPRSMSITRTRRTRWRRC